MRKKTLIVLEWEQIQQNDQLVVDSGSGIHDEEKKIRGITVNSEYA
jgi:hypothetical protein